jgi:hypothetical protein
MAGVGPRAAAGTHPLRWGRAPRAKVARPRRRPYLRPCSRVSASPCVCGCHRAVVNEGKGVAAPSKCGDSSAGPCAGSGNEGGGVKGGGALAELEATTDLKAAVDVGFPRMGQRRKEREHGCRGCPRLPGVRSGDGEVGAVARGFARVAPQGRGRGWGCLPHSTTFRLTREMNLMRHFTARLEDSC